MTSSYRDRANDITAMGYDCSGLTDDQMDRVGMAEEQGDLVWHWAQAELNGNEEHDNKVVAAQREIRDCVWNTELECVGAYVEGMWSELGL